jgi:hypothetical protein
VNKWVVRFWGVLALVALGALIGTSVWPAEPGGTPDALLPNEAPSDVTVAGPWVPFLPADIDVPTRPLVTDRPVKPNPQLAASALHAFFRTTEETYIARALANAHARLATASRSQPDARRAADVLLRRGLNAMEVDELLSRHKLDYMSLETKAPVSDGSVMTHATLAGAPRARLPGTIAEQVEHDIDRYRYYFEQRARMSATTEESAHELELARSPEVGVYRVEVAGTYRDLAELIEETEVRGVVAEIDGQRARVFDDWMAEQRKNTRIIRTRRVLVGE